MLAEVLLWGSIVLAIVLTSWLALLIFPLGIVLMSLMFSAVFPLRPTESHSVSVARRSMVFELGGIAILVFGAYLVFGRA